MVVKQSMAVFETRRFQEGIAQLSISIASVKKALIYSFADWHSCNASIGLIVYLSARAHAAAFLGAIEYFIPYFGPFLSPHKRPSAAHTNLRRQVGFFDHFHLQKSRRLPTSCSDFS
tara:strand:- start:8217 stop:8567 length:351 start_codon:yes stop_codon:yes gene_type:complete